MLPRVLVIAGSDSGGGAGIQGDMHTIAALEGYATTAITALTAQNTQGVTAVHAAPVDFVVAQIDAILSDIGADSIKTGMLYSAEIIEAVAVRLKGENMPLILDPVMIAKGGSPLLQAEAVAALKEKLIPRATLLTPNLPEAEALTGITLVKNPSNEALLDMAKALKALGAQAVLLKGGHGTSDDLVDVLLDADDKVHYFTSKRIDTPHTHGTGCAYASAIATLIHAEPSMAAAVEKAHHFIKLAIENAPQIGSGHGPINHHKAAALL